MESILDKFSNNSTVWLYSSSIILTNEQANAIHQDIDAYTRNWQAHGMPLKAYGEIKHNNIIALVIDETVEATSGCSIDSSVHFIKSLKEKYGIDFLSRNHITYLNENGVMETTPLQNKETLKDKKVLNTACKTLKEYKENLFIDFNKSAYAKIVVNNTFSLKL